MAVDPDAAFRILILGDFSGREQQRLQTPPGQRLRSRQISRDNFDEVLELLDVKLVQLRVLPDSEPVDIRFRELEHFEPDHLYETLPIFAKLRDLRSRLNSSDGFQAAADEVLAWGRGVNHDSAAPSSDSTLQTSLPESATESADVVVDAVGGSLLDQMLEPSEMDDASGSSTTSEWQRMIENIVSPYLVPGADPRQAELVRCVDDAIQVTMRAVLHHPSFQRLESTWRCLRMLVRQLETNHELSIHLVDISKAEIAQDLLSSTELRGTALHHLLVEQTVETPGAEDWSIVVGSFECLPSDRDAHLLAQLGRLAQAANAALLSSASTSLVGCSGSVDSPVFALNAFLEQSAWQELKSSDVADRILLCWPKFMVRLPYGAATRPIEAFEFEEVAGISDRHRLLWGNSAYLAAILLGQSFSQSGWSMHLSERQEVESLPVWTYNDDGETQLHPCGEFLITQRMIEALQTSGITPLMSIRDSDTLRIGGFYSLAAKKLVGPWN
ncbi:MAG: type VI secretion system contractile sheath large subunit [Pirellulaceae bacterium]